MADSPLTVAEFITRLDDIADRELVGGRLRESPKRFHTPKHSAVSARLCAILGGWEENHPRPRPSVHGPGAGFLLHRDPDTLIGCGVSIASAEQMATTPRKQIYFEGPPILAVEIIEPWNTRGDIVERINLYLESGAAVWEVDPNFQFVFVHRPGHTSESFHMGQEIRGDPYLPGFRVPVARLFGA